MHLFTQWSKCLATIAQLNVCKIGSCYSNRGLHINITNVVGFNAPAAFEHLIFAILVHYIISFNIICKNRKFIIVPIL